MTSSMGSKSSPDSINYLGSGAVRRRRPGVPWQARARAAAGRLGVDTRHVRRLRWIHKAHAVRGSGAIIGSNLRFVLLDPEPDNFTYPIANEPDLIRWVASVSGCGEIVAERWLTEPAADAVLLSRLRAATSGRWLWTKRLPPFGRRLGWYALARAFAPSLAVEVGVHDGLGSLLLLRALERNQEEGRHGRLVSFDVNPTAGWLVSAHPLWELRIESSHDGLPRVLQDVGTLDYFVYDGWHAYEDERHDLDLVIDHLSPAGLVITDDAQVTHALRDTCDDRGFSYAEFQEFPDGHFHPGVVIAVGRPAS